MMVTMPVATVKQLSGAIPGMADHCSHVSARSAAAERSELVKELTLSWSRLSFLQMGSGTNSARAAKNWPSCMGGRACLSENHRL